MKMTLALIISMFAFSANAKTTTSTMSERGFFSVSLNAGSNQTRVLTTDGSYSAFQGSVLGAMLDLRIVGEGQGELRLFGQLNMADLKSREAEDQTLKDTATMWGLKAFFTEGLYLGAGYGTTVQKFAVGSVETSATNPIVGLGVGYEHALGGNVFLGAHAWYQNNPIRADSSVTGNSFAEGASFYVNLIWSPPVTVITTTISGR